MAGRAHTSIGPFDADVSLRPALTGDTIVRIGPLGTLRLDTHDGPFGVVVDAREIHVEEARRLIDRPASLAGVDETVARDTTRAVQLVVARAAVGAIAAATLVVLLRGLTRARLASAVAAGVAVVVVGVAVAGVSWDRDSLSAPRYTGLLTIAPQAIGSLSDVQQRFEAYSGQVSSLVGNLAKIYDTASELPVLDRDGDDDIVRILHVSDLHLHPGGFTLIRQLVEQFDIDAVVDTGDINDWGTSVEARYVEPIASLGVPYVFVRGNHDSSATAKAVAAQPNAVVLDDDVTDVEGIRIWGVGDPRFTPDKTDAVSIAEERAQATAFAPEVVRRVDKVAPVDVVLVHDPRAAEDLAGEIVPLVLAGHMHRQYSRSLDGTLLLVEGSTGGAGLRGLQGDEPVPLTATVLHVSKGDKRLRAFDRIAIEGLGRTGASIERHLVAAPQSTG